MQLLKINATTMYLSMSNAYCTFLSEGSMFQNAICPMIWFFFMNVIIALNKY